MLMVTERQKTILGALVQEYVKTAEPVSSGVLVKKYKLTYSPATVRNELFALDRDGFIYQPHTSAGRVPTDSGYRFFIENSSSGRKQNEKIKKEFRPLSHIKDEFDFLRQSSRLLAKFSREFSMAGFFGRDILYKSGISEVLDRPEFSDEDTAREFGELIDFLDEAIEEHFRPEEILEPKVFIGEENPIREARGYTLMISSAGTPFGAEGMFAILGPRRMDYHKNIGLLRAFNDMFQDNS